MAVLKKRNISVGDGVKSTTYVRVKSESDYCEGKSVHLQGALRFKTEPVLQ